MQHTPTDWPLQVIHRDLKLGNLFLNDRMEVKVRV
jgi:Ser/Thr protein kinase RdoA (MazF antagonist)